MLTLTLASIGASQQPPQVYEAVGFYWGQAPKPPGSASPSFGLPVFCGGKRILLTISRFKSGEMRFLRPFLDKEVISLNKVHLVVFCEAEPRFLLLFLEKEEYC
jgi:hypothetical protein